MKDYIVPNEWKIIEDSYHPEYNQITESLMSLGNGKMGQRANLEETYTGETLQGNYVAGIYYPDKTKVGWWKNGYPEYFAKVLNSCNWLGLTIKVEDEILDVNTCTVLKWHRELDMKTGVLKRDMTVRLASGKELQVVSTRINSMADLDLGAFQYSIKALNFSAAVEMSSMLDFDVTNSDSNYDEKFWEGVSQNADEAATYVVARTKKTAFTVGLAQDHQLSIDGQVLTPQWQYFTNEKQSGQVTKVDLEKDSTLRLEKFAVTVSSLNVATANIKHAITSKVNEAKSKGWSAALKAHEVAWSDIWSLCDVRIEGDVSAQQGIRFNIFQLFQTYTGHDHRLNIGPKGFTGEKYGGSTYWDTEAYCLPFYLGTADPTVAKNLLIYRFNQLDKAIENAEKLGFVDGAALFPMVTMNGEECHNEWEITFEEIHRNGAIAYAIFDYIRYTGDRDYLAEYGFEVLLAIARFWAQRVNWSAAKNQYVMLGITGPNEYENNVNNNWYTNYIAQWCLQYAKEVAVFLKEENIADWERIANKTEFEDAELKDWEHIIDNMYFPYDEGQEVYLQQDGFMDKELIPVSELSPESRPLNQKWSWDRILRSCYIKQADVLQGFYFFEEDFTMQQHEDHFLFYEPLTVHESSLSPCVHSILASKLKMDDKAYEMYLRTSRLDLDDYNNDTEDGCHITSMAGTWLAIVKGFGGQRVKNGKLSIAPRLPKEWEKLSFKIKFRGVLYNISLSSKHVKVCNLSDMSGEIYVYDSLTNVINGESIMVNIKS